MKNRGTVPKNKKPDPKFTCLHTGATAEYCHVCAIMNAERKLAEEMRQKENEQ